MKEIGRPTNQTEICECVMGFLRECLRNIEIKNI